MKNTHFTDAAKLPAAVPEMGVFFSYFSRDISLYIAKMCARIVAVAIKCPTRKVGLTVKRRGTEVAAESEKTADME